MNFNEVDFCLMMGKLDTKEVSALLAKAFRACPHFR